MKFPAERVSVARDLICSVARRAGLGRNLRSVEAALVRLATAQLGSQFERRSSTICLRLDVVELSLLSAPGFAKISPSLSPGLETATLGSGR